MIKIQTTTETIESKGGMILAGKVAEKAGLLRIKSAFVNNAGAVIVSLFGLMMEGKSDFESMGGKTWEPVFQGSAEAAGCIRERNGKAVS